MRHADQHSAARLAARRAMHRLHLRNGSAREQTADVNHFVSLGLRENALEAARAGALLYDECGG